MELIATIQNGQAVLTPEQRELERRYLASLKDGTKVRKRWTRIAAKRTSQQVKAHWGLVIMLMRAKMEELGWDICGVVPNKQMIHDILKRSCGGVGDSGELLGLSEMTVPQAMQFFENCRDWAASELAVYIPEPDPNWRENHERD